MAVSINRDLVFKKLLALLKADSKNKDKYIAATEETRRDAAPRMEARYDSRKEEAGRMVEAQKKLQVQTTKIIDHFSDLANVKIDGSKVDIGSIVELNSGKNKLIYLMAKLGGGMTIKLAKDNVMVLSDNSDIGKALIGKKLGSQVEIFHSAFKVSSIV